MRLLALGSALGLVLSSIGCAGEDLSSGDPGAQGGAGTSQGGQGGSSVGGQAGSTSGAGGQAGGGQAGGGQAGGGLAGGGLAGSDPAGGAGQGGLSGSSGQAGAGGDPVPMAGQGGIGGVGGEAGNSGGAPMAGNGGGPPIAGSGGAPPMAGSGGASPSGGQAGMGPTSECSEVGLPCTIGNTEMYGVCSATLVCLRSTNNISGCSDGSREGLKNLSTYPRLAACQGAWSTPGLDPNLTGCDRGAGNNIVQEPKGECRAADLCADTWHVCQGLTDTKARIPLDLPTDMTFCKAAIGPANALNKQAFFATGEGLLGGPEGTCSQNGDFGVVGCGTAPFTNNITAISGCSSFNAAVNAESIGDEKLWTFDVGESSKSGLRKLPGQGGVLCCRDN